MSTFWEELKCFAGPINSGVIAQKWDFVPFVSHFGIEVVIGNGAVITYACF